MPAKTKKEPKPKDKKPVEDDEEFEKALKKNVYSANKGNYTVLQGTQLPGVESSRAKVPKGAIYQR